MIYQMQRWQYLSANPQGLRRHRNPGIEISFVLAGQFAWEVEGTEYRVRPGEAFVTLPWQAHGGVDGLINRGTMEFIIIHLLSCRKEAPWRWGSWSVLDRADEVFVEDALKSKFCPRIEKAGEIRSLFDLLRQEVMSDRPGRVSLVRALLGELLVRVARLLAEGQSDPASTDKRVAAVLEAVVANMDHPWQLEEMVGWSGLGRTRFADITKGMTGMSPMKYLQQQRIDRAKKLLVTSDHSITRIAFEVGYCSSQYFADVFRKECGMTPSQYRQTYSE